MRELSTWVSKLDYVSSTTEKMLKDLLSGIGSILLDLKNTPVVSFVVILIHALIFISCYTLIFISCYNLINLINKRYENEKNSECNRELFYNNKSPILEEAKKVHQDLMDKERIVTKPGANFSFQHCIITMSKAVYQLTGRVVSDITFALLIFSSGFKNQIITKSGIGSNKAHGIITMSKTVYQLTGIIVSAIALALSIFSLCSCTIYLLGFQNQMKASFAHRCCILFSPLIVFVSVALQKGIISNHVWILKNLKIKKIPLHYNRDFFHFTRSIDHYSIKCAKLLSCASFLYLVAAYKLPSILGTPIFIVCTNLCFALYKFIFDSYYVYSCNIFDNKTIAIIMDAPIEVTDGNGTSSKKLSQIIVSGKTSELIHELKKRHSMLKNMEQECSDIKHKHMFAIQMAVMQRAIKFLNTYKVGYDNESIEIKIHPSSIENTENIATYSYTLDGNAAIMYKNRRIYAPKDGKFDEMSNQYLSFNTVQFEELFGNLVICEQQNIIKEHKESMVLIDFVATIVAAQYAAQLNSEKVRKMTSDIPSEISKDFTSNNSLKSQLEFIKPKFVCTGVG